MNQFPLLVFTVFMLLLQACQADLQQQEPIQSNENQPSIKDKNNGISQTNENSETHSNSPIDSDSIQANGYYFPPIKPLAYLDIDPDLQFPKSTKRTKNPKPIVRNEPVFEHLQTLLNQFSSAPFIYQLNPNKDTLIACEQGTKLFFPANCFQLKDGSLPNKTIELKIKEVYTYVDMISNQLSTTSGDQLLETAGMVHLEATSEQQELEIKPGERYTIYFPKKGQAEDMQAFYGNQREDSITDWVLATDNTSNKIIENRLPEDTPCKINVDLTSELKRKKVEWKLKNSELNFIQYFNQNFIPPPSMKSDLCTDFKTIGTEIKFNANGTVSEVHLVDKASDESNEAIVAFLKALPPVNTASMGKFSEKTTYRLLFSANIKRHTEELKQALKNQVNTGDFAQLALSNYVMNVAQLGWINCDSYNPMFQRRNDITVDANVEGICKVMMIFEGMKGIINQNSDQLGTIFKNVPVNFRVKLIGINIRNGKIEFALLKMKTNNTKVELSNFREVSLEELELELKNLD